MSSLNRRRGFTLVEVLIATSLLALVLLGMLTAMRAFARSEARIDERVRIDEDLRVADRFLRGVLASISPRPRPEVAGAPRQIDFSGTADQLSWIGVMPARHGAGGMYRFHLHLRPADLAGPAALVLDFAPYIAGADGPLDASAVMSRVMVAPVGAVRFRYQDDLKSGEQWHDAWPHVDRLPQRIALEYSGMTQPWPEMVVAVVPVSGPLALGGGGITSGPAVGPR